MMNLFWGLLALPVKLLRLPFDVVFLTWELLRVVLWWIRGVPLVLQGAPRPPFSPRVNAGSEEIDGVDYRVCTPIRKYGNRWLFGLLFPDVTEVEAEDGRSISVWTRSSRLAPVSLLRFLLVGFGVAAFWLVCAACIGAYLLRQGHHAGLLASDASQQAGSAVAGSAASLDPAQAQRAYERADRYAAEGRTRDALAEYTRATEHDPTYLEAHLKLALTAMELDARDQARKAFAAVLKLDPQHSEARLGVAEILMEEGAAGKARDMLLPLQRTAPEDVRIGLLLARTHLALKDLQAAQDLCRQLFASHPGETGVVRLSAQLEAAAGNLDTAEQLYRRMIDLSPMDREARLGLITVLRSKGNLQGAQATAVGMLEDFPEDPEAVHHLVQVLRLQGHIAEALEVCNRILEKAPDLVQIREEFASLLLAVGQYDAACKHADRLLQDHPGNVQAHLLLATLFMHKDLPTLALDHARKALAHNINTLPAHRILANASLKTGDLQAAKTKLEQILKVVPRDLESMLKLAECHERLEAPEQAGKLLKEALEYHPDSVPALTEMGKHHFVRNNLDAALACFSRAHTLSPDAPQVQNNLAVMLAHMNRDLDQAQTLALAALAQERGNPSIADTAGWIYLLRGDREQALPLLQYAVTARPGSASVQYHYARALSSGGDHEQAKAHLQTALRLSQSFPEVEAARNLLRTLESPDNGRTPLTQPRNQP